ncbi:uncharacterized protein [Diadema setosum]|uniref:uncharacterized protein n=1 Tax=Diadema setosum TaxID=31175 RepID=UPI003B3B0985
MERKKPASTSRTQSLGNSITMKNQQKRSLHVVWKSLDQEREHFLKLMALNEKFLRSRQEKREERMSHLKSHLTMPQIVEIEKNERRSRTRQQTQNCDVQVIYRESASEDDDDDDEDDDGDEDSSRPSSLSIESSINGAERSTSFYGHNRSRNSAGTETEKHRSSPPMKQANMGAEPERNSRSAPKSRINWSDRTPGLSLSKTYPLAKDEMKQNGDMLVSRISSGNTGSERKRTLSRTSKSVSGGDHRHRSSSSLSMRSSFSCHEERKQEAMRSRSHSVDIQSFSPNSTTNTTSSKGSNDNVFHDAIDALKREKTRVDLRRMMVVENDMHFLHLQRRKESLLHDIGEMVKRDRELAQKQLLFPSVTEPMNVPLNTMSQDELIETVSKGTADLPELRKEIRRRKMERMGERMRKAIPKDELQRLEGETDDEYSTRLEKWRRDIKKVRYLRRVSSKNDFTDVVTLAMEQQKNNRIWSQSLRDNLF